MEHVFLFEYATCGAFKELEPSITVEGLGMFKILLDGFKDVYTFIDRRIPLFNYPKVSDYRDKFAEYLGKAAYCLIIAPETDNILYDLTLMAEKIDCPNLGSNTQGILDAGDKYRTYKKLKKYMPKTEIYDGKTSIDLPAIAKPRDGVSCEGVSLIKSESDLRRVPRGYLIQEYVPGKACSASLIIGDDVHVISINTQEIRDFKYHGAKIPFNLENVEDIISAAEKIKGLFGYVGVDFVLNEKVNIIEINPRPTVPIIALNDVYGFNISELLLRNYHGKEINKYLPKKSVYLKKEKGTVTGSYVSYGGYSISWEMID